MQEVAGAQGLELKQVYSMSELLALSDDEVGWVGVGWAGEGGKDGRGVVRV